jgi:hypothetical protein
MAPIGPSVCSTVIYCILFTLVTFNNHYSINVPDIFMTSYPVLVCSAVTVLRLHMFSSSIYLSVYSVIKVQIKSHIFHVAKVVNRVNICRINELCLSGSLLHTLRYVFILSILYVWFSHRGLFLFFRVLERIYFSITG